MEAAYFYLPTDPSKSLIGEKKKIQAVWIERERERRETCLKVLGSG